MSALARRCRHPGPLVRAAVVLLVLSLGLAPALAQAALAGDADRQDNVFGTTREGLDMGRDPGTGDEYMRLAPPEQQPEPGAMPPVEIRPEIRPEIRLPAKPGQGGGQP